MASLPGSDPCRGFFVAAMAHFDVGAAPVASCAGELFKRESA